MKSPRGGYKLSRNAVLAAELPTSYTSRNQWRGSLPKAILTAWCQHHHLPDPSFSLFSSGCRNSGSAITQEVAHAQSGKAEIDDAPKQLTWDDGANKEKDSAGGPFESRVTVQWKDGTVITCLSENPFRSQVEAKQSASLGALHQVISMFDAHLDALGDDHPFRVIPDKRNGLICCPESGMLMGVEKDGTSATGLRIIDGNEIFGQSPVHGSMVCVAYEVDLSPLNWERSQHLTTPEQFIRVESNNEFEFELGSNAIVPQLEYCVSTMSVGQTATFFTRSPPHGLLLATGGALADVSGKWHSSKASLLDIFDSFRQLFQELKGGLLVGTTNIWGLMQVGF